MTAQIIDGTKISQDLRLSLKTRVEVHVAAGKRAPCLAVVLVGEDPASKIYVGHKEKGCSAIGITSRSVRMPAETTQSELNKVLRQLNDDPSVDGILLQLPLPRHLNKDQAIDEISPDKDVDGLTVLNQGRLVCQRPGLFSCTPAGCMELLKATGIKVSGKRAAVIGRSLLVGSPVRTMLIHEGATVTTIHSKTPDAAAIVRESDIVIAAAGVPELVKKDWIKPGAVVIDVGMHRGEKKLIGDVAFDEVREVAGYLTPVPGGVGPMTIAMLLYNCVKAYEKNLLSE
jgi:methylenetetrahydrofolate dehydrogenase (NADP+)/methenyltetrahydrofolate cyclohydrolase